MQKTSAGLLMYRFRHGKPEFFLAHPGGPFWARKDEGAWTIPKGLCEPGEDLLSCAVREFGEETGFGASGSFIPLGELRQPSGKVIHVWAFAGEFDPAALVSNTFRMEWPLRSGNVREFPEADRAAWFQADEALKKIAKGQAAFIERLVRELAGKQRARIERK